VGFLGIWGSGISSPGGINFDFGVFGD